MLPAFKIQLPTQCWSSLSPPHLDCEISQLYFYAMLLRLLMCFGLCMPSFWIFIFYICIVCAFTHCAFFKVGETRYKNNVVVIRAVVWSSSLATARIPPPLLLLRWHFQYVCHLFILLILLYYSSCDSFSHLPFLSPTTTTYTNNLYCTATI